MRKVGSGPLPVCSVQCAVCSLRWAVDGKHGEQLAVRTGHCAVSSKRRVKDFCSQPPRFEFVNRPLHTAHRSPRLPTAHPKI